MRTQARIPTRRGQEHKGFAQSTAGQGPFCSSSRICWFRSESHSSHLTQSPRGPLFPLFLWSRSPSRKVQVPVLWLVTVRRSPGILRLLPGPRLNSHWLLERQTRKGFEVTRPIHSFPQGGDCTPWWGMCKIPPAAPDRAGARPVFHKLTYAGIRAKLCPAV